MTIIVRTPTVNARSVTSFRSDWKEVTERAFTVGVRTMIVGGRHLKWFQCVYSEGFVQTRQYQSAVENFRAELESLGDEYDLVDPFSMMASRSRKYQAMRIFEFKISLPPKV